MRAGAAAFLRAGGERARGGRRAEDGTRKGVKGGTAGDRGETTKENLGVKLVRPSNPLPCFKVRAECDGTGSQ